MGSRIESQLRNGVIFGDISNNEYIYIPSGECGSTTPIPVYENNQQRDDISFADAMTLISKRSLKPVTHPVLGSNIY